MPDETANIIAIRIVQTVPLGLYDRDLSGHTTVIAREMELEANATISPEQLHKLLSDARRDFGPGTAVELRLITESESQTPYWKAFGEWIQAQREEEPSH